jgi:hypothetical protein
MELAQDHSIEGALCCVELLHFVTRDLVETIV